MKSALAFASIAWIFVASTSTAQTGGTINRSDEGLNSGAAFQRRVGVPITPAAQPPAYMPSVPLAFDEQGRSNELIVTLAYANKTALKQIVPALADSATRQTTEAEVVKAVRQYERAADFALQSPMAAGHLIETGRLQASKRAELGAGHPRERLEQYLLLRYVSVAAALQAQEKLKSHPGLASVANNMRLSLSWAPNDQYFAVQPNHRHYQWGLHEMNFPAAWDVSTGHGYIGVLEPGVPNNLSALPEDVRRNHRDHMAYNDLTSQPTQTFLYHATHVLGILGATTNNNGIGIAGACPTCSTSLFKIPGPIITISSAAFAMTTGVERGMQVLNWSGGFQPFDSSTNYPECGQTNSNSLAVAPLCDVLAFAHRRKVMLFSAAGNGETALVDDGLNRPQFPGEEPAVIAVAGAEKRYEVPGQLAENCAGTSWCQWRGTSTQLENGWRNRSNAPGAKGVYAPARSIVSTVAASSSLGHTPLLEGIYHCSDAATGDESGIPGDGYGSCTGTSMAAPHVSALAGILRSINPLLPALSKDHLDVDEPLANMSIAAIIQWSQQVYIAHPRWGFGMPNAATAVSEAVRFTPNRLTPMFAFYSWGRDDYFYTTVPQMASAALWGTMFPCTTGGSCAPWYHSRDGMTVASYPEYPDTRRSGVVQSDWIPRAEFWVFTTPLNPKNASLPLVPLYRFSWRCTDWTPYPPAACATNPHHIDTVYSADPVNGIWYFEGLGYKLDGTEGYIYPMSMAQPPGTVRLMRKYNPTLDDHAIFPETRLSEMLAAGYTANTGNTDWIGYVYPNTNGNVPAIQ
jgi:hypothetical protein